MMSRELENKSCPICGAPQPGGCNCLDRYSKDFQDLLLTQDPRSLIEGSHVHDVDFKEWEDERAFLSATINQDGTMLDAGCANGFLLRCLQEWSPHRIEPYGIDADGGRIAQAKQLFPEQQDHFVFLDLLNLRDRGEAGLPETFDTVCWNVWDAVDFDDPREVAMLRLLLEATAKDGRLVLGFYHPQKEHSMAVIQKLRSLGYAFHGVLEHPNGRSEVAAWLDKNSGWGQGETTVVEGQEYSITELNEFAEKLPVEDVLTQQLREAISETHQYWEDREGNPFGPSDILQNPGEAYRNPLWADHIASMMTARLEDPIWVMRATGQVINGTHRLTLAFFKDMPTVKVKWFDTIPDKPKENVV